MLKKIGLPAIALLGLLAVAPYQAKAAVRVVVAHPVCVSTRLAPARVVVERPYVRHEIRRAWIMRHDARRLR